MTRYDIAFLWVLVASPALAQGTAAPPDPAFKKLPAYCLTASKSLDGTTLTDDVDKIDDTLDDSDRRSTCDLASATLERFLGLRDQLARCARQAGSTALGHRFSEGSSKLDGMISHVRATQSGRSCQSQ